jgi:hypothetical protein
MEAGRCAQGHVSVDRTRRAQRQRARGVERGRWGSAGSRAGRAGFGEGAGLAGGAATRAVELVWVDAAFVPRMRRRPGWKEIMAQAKARPNDDDVPGEAPPEKWQEARGSRAGAQWRPP